MTRKCRDTYTELGYDIASIAIDELVERLKEALIGGETFRLDFLEYAELKMKDMTQGTVNT